MTTAKELLDAATPLPWTGDSIWKRKDTTANVRLIVYAVNRLPDYEAAVEALTTCIEVFADSIAGRDDRCGPDCVLTDEGHDAIDAGRAVLARLRSEVPA